MPIANCIIHSSLKDKILSSDDLVKHWANAAKQSSKHMTINIVSSDYQFGNNYAIMATLYLPSLWSDTDISLIQEGLATALSQYFETNLDDVHVITQIVESGRVVESGKEIHWS